MDGIARTVNAMKRAFCGAIALSGMMAVVGEGLSRGERGGFPYNPFALEDVLMPIFAFDDPAPSVECDGGVGEVGDRDEVDEGMWRIRVHSLAVVKIDEAIQCGS